MALLAATLCGAGPARAQAAGSTLTLTVTDSSLRGPTTFTAGVVTMQVVNRGRGVHQVQLLQIANGRTVAETKAYILANDRPPLQWTQLGLGIGPIESGQTNTVTFKLDPGTYLLVDLMPNAKGELNYHSGVWAPLSGAGTVGRELPNIPAVAGLIIANRFRFGNLFKSGNTWTQSESRDRSTTVRPGLQTIRIESYVAPGHGVVLARGGPEVIRQYQDWTNGQRPTPPPGLVGGVVAVPGPNNNQPGRMAYNRVFLQVRLTVGGYILFCPVVDRQVGRHSDVGEFTQFSVQ